ncbi:aliphatic sulfonate ABC transporter substrate-binding protein [Kaistia dalseonensis]|uniref:Sulfonate transport system substrate-binding protein n=1 Tax=Kaistia dalseonensis TaxID=410840 RepID=A0ABU0HF36_9HYPH|nr:aliphatic sulfonate ABC transporter substrate-binding protein [Kaistia dalseonensis]MCX5497814.1 aliphatic sulfonate ABC transporter substrate-binding protein [Kaistia dalseonensis]MDQ0440458.1 sulfonate transport system substrate-binding protein [Kaistia dalseonensis]
MKLTRRGFGLLAGAGLAGLAGTTISPVPSRAAEPLKELKVGYQKAGLLALARREKSIEKQLAASGTSVKWVEFASGPPLLEALNVGAVDIGWTGDAPPIFAQAAGANLVYIAAAPSNGKGEAIIVKDGSPVQSVADLKGKKIAVTKGSSAHNLAVAALEKAGVAWADITPVYLSPADAAAAFANDSVDAWSIWDPFLALAESRQKVRQLTTTADTIAVNTYLLANRTFATDHPEAVVEIVKALGGTAEWANAHRGEVAQALSEITGVPIGPQTVAVDRAAYAILPLTDAIIAGQQTTADRFQKLGLIPKPIVVREIVWTSPKA